MLDRETYSHNGSERDVSALKWRHPVEDIEPDESPELTAASYIRWVCQWLSDGGSIVQVGQRTLAMIYCVQPSIIGGATLQEIGDKSAVARQAIDKYVTDFRDTFPGIKSRVMRDEETREACRKAQLSRS